MGGGASIKGCFFLSEYGNILIFIFKHRFTYITINSCPAEPEFILFFFLKGCRSKSAGF